MLAETLLCVPLSDLVESAWAIGAVLLLPWGGSALKRLASERKWLARWNKVLYLMLYSKYRMFFFLQVENIWALDLLPRLSDFVEEMDTVGYLVVGAQVGLRRTNMDTVARVDSRDLLSAARNLEVSPSQ